MTKKRFMNPFTLRDDSNITPSNESTIRGIRTKSYLIGPIDCRYDETLEQHNIAIKPYKDPIIDKVRKLIDTDLSDQSKIVSILEKRKEDESEEKRWQLDKYNCAHSNEARFQRTMMMDMLNRHALNEKTDFVCEATWDSHRFPCRDCSAEQCKISKPTPDLAVGFQPDSLLMDDEFSIAWTRLKSLEGYIFPEGTKQDRAFHFFSMEVKGKRGTLDNKAAQDQNLNTASQALYNIYRCMKEANELNLFLKRSDFSPQSRRSRDSGFESIVV